MLGFDWFLLVREYVKEWCRNSHACTRHEAWEGTLIAPSALVVFLVLTFWWLVVLRSCCNTCGGRAPSRGCLRPSREEFDGYSGFEVVSLKIAAAVLGFVCLILLMVTFQQSNKFSDGVYTSTNALSDFCDILDDAASNANTTFNALPPYITAEDSSAFSNASHTIHKHASYLRNVSETLELYEGDVIWSESRYYNMLWLVCVAGVTILVTGIPVACNVTRCLPMTMAGLLSVVCIVLCAVASVYEYVAVVSNEMCHKSEYYVNKGSGELRDYLSCEEESDNTDGIHTWFELTDEAYSYFGMDVCYDASFLCGSVFECVKCDETSLTTVLFKSQINASHNATCTRNQCSIAQCAEWCVEGDIRQQCVDIMESWMKYTPRFKAVRRALLLVKDCEFVDVFCGIVQDSVCSVIRSASYGLFGCLLAVGSLLVACMVTLLLTTKRFARDATLIPAARVPMLQATSVVSEMHPKPLSAFIDKGTQTTPPPPTYGTASTELRTSIPTNPNSPSPSSLPSFPSQWKG